MQLKSLMVQLTYLNLNGAKRLSYIFLYDLYGLEIYDIRSAIWDLGFGIWDLGFGI
jgi:hypothetical protein